MNNNEMHPAEAYLRNPNNPASLYVRINGKRRRLFINRQEGVIGIIAERKRRRGYKFHDWSSIEVVYYPTYNADDDRKKEVLLTLKFKKLASHATHTNDWLRQIAAADPEKTPYENHITTGTSIDGKCISLSTIEKYCGYMAMACFREAMKRKEKYSSHRFDFYGYDGTLWCEPRENGDMVAGFMKEYRNTGNGYYYLLINDNAMIGYDID